MQSLCTLKYNSTKTIFFLHYILAALLQKNYNKLKKKREQFALKILTGPVNFILPYQSHTPVLTNQQKNITNKKPVYMFVFLNKSHVSHFVQKNLN